MIKDMFGLRKKNKEEKKTQKSINKFGPTFDQNLFINFHIFLSSIFFSETKHIICE
jgi:hypothetical protein